ncbi:MAG: hypothetical protein K9G70_02305 [Prolixibacteraceae bacterium]|nr:hypothetical protein [Prolixibacteraceae bacterium]
MLIPLLLVILGFACLVFGANWLVDGASALAKKYKVSDLAIGLTIVANETRYCCANNNNSKIKHQNLGIDFIWISRFNSRWSIRCC